MPLLIAAFWGALIQIMGTLVGKIILALGLSFVTYQGMDTLVGFGEGYVIAHLQGLPADAIQFFAWMNLDKAVSMIFSAMTSAFAIKSIGGSITRARISPRVS